MRILFGIIVICFMGFWVPMALAQATSSQNPPDLLGKLTGADTKLAAGERIAVFGDSITMQGGYLRVIEEQLRDSEHTKELGIKLLPHGLNGGRVPTVLAGKSPWGDLGAPMEHLLRDEKPTIVVILLGINDVWHGDQGTPIGEFESGLKDMIRFCRDSNSDVILCTPSVIGEALTDNAMNETLGKYAESIRALAKSEKLTLCDVHLAFREKLAEVNPNQQHQGNLTYDGVHLNDAGNALMAQVVAGAIHELTQAR